MKIGLDFDNCIISYDDKFYEAAIALNYFVDDGSVEKSKLGVRNFLRKSGNEDLWTALQGYVYGVLIDSASPYPGAVKAISDLTKLGHELVIISHKTATPFLGPNYDLHQAALKWIDHNLNIDGDPLISRSCVHFNTTLIGKIQCIKKHKCDLFFDDLPEILGHCDFPTTTQKVLFSPNCANPKCDHDVISVDTWFKFSELIQNERF